MAVHSLTRGETVHGYGWGLSGYGTLQTSRNLLGRQSLSGRLFGSDSGGKTCHSHCWVLLGHIALWVGRVLLRDGLEMAGHLAVTLGEGYWGLLGCTVLCACRVNYRRRSWKAHKNNYVAAGQKTNRLSRFVFSSVILPSTFYIETGELGSSLHLSMKTVNLHTKRIPCSIQNGK